MRRLGLWRFGRGLIRVVTCARVGVGDGLINRLVGRCGLIRRRQRLAGLAALSTRGLAGLRRSRRRAAGLTRSSCALPLPLTGNICGILGSAGSKPFGVKAHAQEFPFAVMVVLIPGAQRGGIVAARYACDGEALGSTGARKRACGGQRCE